MTTKQNAQFEAPIAKLREIFQIDRPELDFGIYRILHGRAGEISGDLENRLAEKVQAASVAGDIASAQQLRGELQEAKKNAHALSVRPDGVPNIPTVLTQTAEEGGATRVLKLSEIEPEFLARMFSVEDI